MFFGSCFSATSPAIMFFAVVSSFYLSNKKALSSELSALRDRFTATSHPEPLSICYTALPTMFRVQ